MSYVFMGTTNRGHSFFILFFRYFITFSTGFGHRRAMGVETGETDSYHGVTRR